MFQTSAKEDHGSGSQSASVQWKYLLRVLGLLAILAAAGFLIYKAYPRIVASSLKAQKIFTIQPENEDQRAKSSAIAPGVEALSAQEKEMLYHEVTVSADRTPEPAEQEILARVVPFQTGWAEKVPSGVWTLAQYQKMIADQETFYKMPFARSYKKKLEELFKTKYLAASDAFAKGDILAARDLWVGSLAFPLYSTDLKKHRAVALTMLRPFINDTLSKVSAMNQSLQDRGRRSQEQALSVEYQKFSGLISQKKWQEALTAADPILQGVCNILKNVKTPAAVPPYPVAFGTIDADLQRPLMDLMTPAPVSMADLQPLQQDLVEKKEVLVTFTEDYVKNAMAVYQAALGAIREQRWKEAAQALGSIQGPLALQRDAVQKAAILGKMMPQTLDSK